MAHWDKSYSENDFDKMPIASVGRDKSAKPPSNVGMKSLAREQKTGRGVMGAIARKIRKAK